MKISRKGKLYLILSLNIIILAIGIYLSAEFDNKWLTLIATIICYFIIAYSIMNFKAKFPKRKIKYKTQPNTIIPISIGVLGLYFIIAWVLPISFSLLLNKDYVDIITYNYSLFTILESLLIFPFIEEIMFRRIISQKIYNSNGFYPALWISSILFSLSHINTDSGLLGIFIGGLFLGYIYLKTKNIWLSIFAHIFHNSLILILTPQITDAILGITKYWVFGIFIVFSLSLIFIMVFQINKIKENKRLVNKEN